MPERSTADILRAAKARISDPRHYVRGVLAWDKDARDVEPTDHGAVRLNGRGAICVELGGKRTPAKEQADHNALPPYRYMQQAAERLIEQRVIPPWRAACPYAGCHEEHAHMMATFDEAIRLAEEAEAHHA